MKTVIVTVLVTLVVAATISALSIVSYVAVTSDADATPQPDRVVAVLAKCQQRVSRDNAIDMTGPQCQYQEVDNLTIINARLQLTVRTSEGSAYQIDVPITTKVAVGDAWPK